MKAARVVATLSVGLVGFFGGPALPLETEAGDLSLGWGVVMLGCWAATVVAASAIYRALGHRSGQG